MTDIYSSWSRPLAEQKFLPSQLYTISKQTSPIPIPRRKSVQPPPCSPTRNQDSPEFVFNLDFSISPDSPDATAHALLQQSSANVQRYPLQKGPYFPLASLGTNNQDQAHPYAHEPFLYPVPKPPPADQKSRRSLKEQIAPTAPAHSTQLGYPVRSSRSSRLSSANTSTVPPDNVSPLISAFQGTFVSESVTSSYNYTSNSQDIESHRLSRPIQSYTPSPSPPLDNRMRHTTLQRPAALQRTHTAAPIVSLNITQAQRSDRCLGIDREERSQSSSSGIVPRRTRRSSSVGAGLNLVKLCDPTRRMGTVVGRGAGRVISMFEYGNPNSRSLVSDEDIEESLEKDRLQEITRGPKRAVHGEKNEVHGCSSPVRERGRARERASVAATQRMGAPSGWQWLDTR